MRLFFSLSIIFRIERQVLKFFHVELIFTEIGQDLGHFVQLREYTERNLAARQAKN